MTDKSPRNPDLKHVVVVSGLGRCGSSLVMQMLNAGGVPATDKKYGAAYPMFEDERASKLLPKDKSWVKHCVGQCVKILNPDHFTPPALDEMKCIFMVRDQTEQAKSWRKYGYGAVWADGSYLGEYIPARKMKALIKKRERNGIKVMKRCARGGYIVLRYEGVLAYPDKAALIVTALLGIPMDVEAMVRAVVKRDGKCLDGFLEPTLMKNLQDSQLSGTT